MIGFKILPLVGCIGQISSRDGPKFPHGSIRLADEVEAGASRRYCGLIKIALADIRYSAHLDRLCSLIL